MTSSILLNIPCGDTGFIAQINGLIAIHYSATLADTNVSHSIE